MCSELLGLVVIVLGRRGALSGVGRGGGDILTAVVVVVVVELMRQSWNVRQMTTLSYSELQ